MEKEINVFNNEIFTELLLKIRVRRKKKKFIIYHFLVKSHDPFFVQISETRPPPFNFRGEETMKENTLLFNFRSF